MGSWLKFLPALVALAGAVAIVVLGVAPPLYT
jgi:hypothetical protein